MSICMYLYTKWFEFVDEICAEAYLIENVKILFWNNDIWNLNYLLFSIAARRCGFVKQT